MRWLLFFTVLFLAAATPASAQENRLSNIDTLVAQIAAHERWSPQFDEEMWRMLWSLHNASPAELDGVSAETIDRIAALSRHDFAWDGVAKAMFEFGPRARRATPQLEFVIRGDCERHARYPLWLGPPPPLFWAARAIARINGEAFDSRADERQICAAYGAPLPTRKAS